MKDERERDGVCGQDRGEGGGNGSIKSEDEENEIAAPYWPVLGNLLGLLRRAESGAHTRGSLEIGRAHV